MSFSYYDKDNNIKRLNIEVGKEWSSYKEKDENSLMNSVFDAVDVNSDGKVDEGELNTLQRLLKIADSQIEKFKNNNTIEQEELRLLVDKISTLDLGTLETNKIITPEIIDIPNTKYKNDEYLIESNTKIITAVVDYSNLNNLEEGKYYIKSWKYSWNDDRTVITGTPEVSKVQHSNQDGIKNWSEGINRNITKIQFDSYDISDELKAFMEKIGEEQGFFVKLLDTKNRWIEDYSVVRADKKQLIPYHDSKFTSKLSISSEQQQLIIAERKNITGKAQGTAGQKHNAEKYSKIVAEEDVIQGKTYLEGGNVLNTLTKDGKPAAIIGEESIKYTMLAMGLKDSAESREIAKKQIAEELGIKEENITYIHQFDFHIDMYYRPLNDGQIGVPDYEAGIKVLKQLVLDIDEKIETSSLISDMKPNFTGTVYEKSGLKYKKQEYLKLIKQLEETKNKTELRTNVAEDELKEKGYEIVKIPCFSVVGNGANPINYMNGICGTSAKTEDKFYITNTSGNETLDACMEKYFKEVVGFDKVYFAPTKNHLKYSGGIDCLTKEF